MIWFYVPNWLFSVTFIFGHWDEHGYVPVSMLARLYVDIMFGVRADEINTSTMSTNTQKLGGRNRVCSCLQHRPLPGFHIDSPKCPPRAARIGVSALTTMCNNAESTKSVENLTYPGGRYSKNIC